MKPDAEGLWSAVEGKMTPICPGKGAGCTFPKCECGVPLERRVPVEKRMATDADRVFGTLPTMAEAEERLGRTLGMQSAAAERGATIDRIFEDLPPLADAAALTDERATTHGSFAVNSETLARLLEALPLERFDRRTWYAVTMIYVKLARMASGQSTSRAHAEDIEGYAHLLVKEIDEGRLA